jgi:serine protease AprX
MVGSTLKICAEYSAIAMRNPKISPAFDPFLRHDRSRRDAIVVYRTPQAERMGRNASRNASPAERSQTRRDLIQHQANQQQAIETQIFERYQTRSQDLISGPPLVTRSLAIGTLPVASVEVTRLTLAALAEEPEVVAILPNQAIHLIQPQAVDYQSLFSGEAEQGCTWGLKQLGIPAAWETTARGAGVRVAVLDSGVYGDHPALKDRVKKFVVVDPLGRRIETQPSFDSGQHGTHVCGTIAGGKTETGVAIGVAPEADLLVAGVLVGNATMMTLIEGLAWAIENEARIINMSLGLEYYEPLFGKILDVLISQYDILPVVAIGNSNHGNTSSPGNSYNAFSVGALEKLPEAAIAGSPTAGPTERPTAAKPTEGSPAEAPTETKPVETKPAETPKPIATDNLAVTFFSSGASLVFPGMEPEPLVNKPDVVAPGAQVYSCIPPEQRPGGTFAYTYMDGTSMACPHVAGVAALLMSANPDASATDVLKALKETALHPAGSDRRPDNRWGYGMVQPLAALELIKLA